MTTDSETMEQYLNFGQNRFFISVPVFVSRDYEPQSHTVLIFQFANAFAIAITFARWRRRSEESTAVPYGAIFLDCVHFVCVNISKHDVISFLFQFQTAYFSQLQRSN